MKIVFSGMEESAHISLVQLFRLLLDIAKMRPETKKIKVHWQKGIVLRVDIT